MITSFNLGSLPALVALVLNAGLAMVLALYDHRRPVHKLFLMLLLQFVAWNAAECALFNAMNPAKAMFFARLDATAVCFLGASSLHLALLFPRRHVLLRRRSIYVLLYGLPLLFVYNIWFGSSFVTGVSFRIWAAYDLDRGILFKWYSVYTIVALVAALSIFYRAYRTADRARERLQGSIMFAAASIPIAIGSVPNLILPLFNIQAYPAAGGLTAICSVVITYAMIKYRLTALTTRTAAEMVIAMMPGIVLLLDVDHRIIHVNRNLLDALGYEEAELMGQHVNIVLTDDEKRRGLIWYRKEALQTGVPVPAHFLTKQNQTIPVMFKGTIITDDSDVFGFVGTGNIP